MSRRHRQLAVAALTIFASLAFATSASALIDPATGLNRGYNAEDSKGWPAKGITSSNAVKI
jgi:hypothetical protein